MNTRVLAHAKPSFKEQMLAAREEAILQAVSRLLAEKGFDAMTVDEVAADVGIAKASLYKHFESKEALAAAAMIGALRRARQFVATVAAQGQAPLERLRAVLRWTLQARLAGQMPPLPSQNSSLRAVLTGTPEYIEALTEISRQLGEWIEAAQSDGSLNPNLPSGAVLYTLYARGCDPVVEFLKAGGRHSDEEIVTLVLSTCFEGLNSR